MCLCIIAASSDDFVTVKNGRIRLWSFKAKYRESHVRDYRYIKEGWRIHYGVASSSISRSDDGLFLASSAGGGGSGGSGGLDRSAEKEH